MEEKLLRMQGFKDAIDYRNYFNRLGGITANIIGAHIESSTLVQVYETNKEVGTLSPLSIEYFKKQLRILKGKKIEGLHEKAEKLYGNIKNLEKRYFTPEKDRLKNLIEKFRKNHRKFLENLVYLKSELKIKDEN